MASQRVIATFTVSSRGQQSRDVGIDVLIEGRNTTEALERLKRATDIFLELGDGRHIITFRDSQ